MWQAEQRHSSCFGPVRGLFGGAAERLVVPGKRAMPIDAQLAEAAKGPYYGPFETADDAIKFMQREIRKRKTANTKTAK